MECNYISVCLFCVIQQKGGIKMTRKEAAIRYALENGELDGLKVWLLNGGDIEEYFVKNKKNIKITIYRICKVC